MSQEIVIELFIDEPWQFDCPNRGLFISVPSDAPMFPLSTSIRGKRKQFFIKKKSKAR